MSLVHACIKIMLDFLFHSGIIKWELIVNIYYKVFIGTIYCPGLRRSPFRTRFRYKTGGCGGNVYRNVSFTGHIYTWI